MKRYLVAAVIAAFFVSALSAKQWIVQLETGHPSAFGKGKAAFALAKNGVLEKLPPQSRHIRDLGIINAIVVESETADELWVEGVKAVEEDGEVELYLGESVPQIRADQVQTLGFTGAGITVGVIDTGIDYTHPDVATQYTGGYDIYSDDLDPMDEHSRGHGTHVSGIITGVSPDVRLYAIKVFGSDGVTTFSIVIAGIEWAIDPNGDGDASDHLDVINMSLGGRGVPTGTTCHAVSSAVEFGVVVVAAAGNSGWPGKDGLFTCNSIPGICEDSITVAANKKSDLGTIDMAWFSSQGPVIYQGKDYKKPDITAPGVSICAAKAGSSTSVECLNNPPRAPLDGTSMSTPHVSGVVALLKQAHPEYTSGEIRRVLQSTARDLGFSYDMQGAGEVDALAAMQAQEPIESPFSFYPSGLWLGGSSGAETLSESMTLVGGEAILEADGYPVQVPASVSGEFEVTAEIPTYLENGMYISRIYADHQSWATVVFAKDDLRPEAVFTNEPLQESPVRIRIELADDLCLKGGTLTYPGADGLLYTQALAINPIYHCGDAPPAYPPGVCQLGQCFKTYFFLFWGIEAPEGIYPLTFEVVDIADNAYIAESTLTVVPNSPLQAPTGLIATLDDSAVDLTWQANSTDEDGFKVERDGVEIATVTDVIYRDLGVSCGEEYQYRVRAYRGEELSDYSSAALAVIPACAPPVDETPPTLTIVAPANGTIVPRKASYTVEAIASDEGSGVAFVRMTRGDAVCTDSTAPYLCQFRTTGKPNARYTISVYAQDEAGNKSATHTVTVQSGSNRK
jgi:subtilisin family serine protease